MLTSKTTTVQTDAEAEIEAAQAQEAHEMGLRYVHDYDKGFSRKRRGKKFTFLDKSGKPITCEKTNERIRKIVIPPAWQDVWICPYANGHLQATGRDVRGRKQYRYHADWTRLRNEAKFERLVSFGRCLPSLRKRLEADLSKPGLPREKVLAATVTVMELTKIRVGNEVYAEENHSYGLTTIRHKHAEVHGTKVQFKFKGKSGIMHDVTFADPRLSRIIRRCQELPGEELFGYEAADGSIHHIGSSDVNAYLKEIAQEEISAKDFRTWGGTMRALEVLMTAGPLNDERKKAQKDRVLTVIKDVATHLRNTTAVCRKYYIHPAIFELDLSGLLHKLAKSKWPRTGIHDQRRAPVSSPLRAAHAHAKVGPAQGFPC